MRTRLALLSVVLLVVISVSITYAATRNLLRNGGFEICTIEKLPDLWGSGNMGLSVPMWVLDSDSWRAHWGVVENERHSGKRCLRIDCPGDPANLTASPSNLSATARFLDLTEPKTSYTLSAWLKSDRPDLPVVIGWQGNMQTVHVARRWSRYSITGTAEGMCYMMSVRPTARGVLWVDDVQLEEGKVATDYVPSPVDASIAGKAVHRIAYHLPDIPITRGPTRPPVVTIDTHRRLLIDGEPFVMFATCWEQFPTREILQHFAAAGFNSLFILLGNENTVAEIQTCMDNANWCGLKVVCSMRREIKDENRKLFITSLRDHPALIVWNVFDEPVTGADTVPQIAYEEARQLDPAHPAYVNYSPGMYFPPTLQSDIACLDSYSIGCSGEPLDQAKYADQLESIASPAGKPSWIALQSGGYAYWWSREPTGPEEESMVYLTLIHGVRGFEFYVYKPFSVELWKEMRMLSREIRQLAPVICSLETPPTVSVVGLCPDVLRSSIHVVGKTYKGERYVIAANASPLPVNGDITVSGGGSAATVLFENRQVNVVRDVINDTFAGYQRHVYRLSDAVNEGQK
jgi:hypothetical protein